MTDGYQQAEVVMTVKEAAARAKIHPVFLYALISQRKGPRVKRVGRSIRITVSSFNRWINPEPKKAK